MSANVDWIVFAPDVADTYERRMSARTQHLAYFKPHIADGRVGPFICRIPRPRARSYSIRAVLGGYTLSPDSVAIGAQEADHRPIGSVFVVRAPTIDAVKAIIKGDVLWTNHVVRMSAHPSPGCGADRWRQWDRERLSILPYVQLLPVAAPTASSA
jgi:hypothetical protein